ncbi:alpha-(1,3)-fucosyltransferase 7 [Strongylocentrotus purpuratus]|uniref:Fucosyltransferase n=1 Tax=Strongylocentrotus purpuratus TaxID=7668 RepID=A0A7M7NML3_STRPU|nr:alpha-(1,3)-fucosyltransferase 7 [Strongylocentrotus purpuratus]
MMTILRKPKTSLFLVTFVGAVTIIVGILCGLQTRPVRRRAEFPMLVVEKTEDDSSHKSLFARTGCVKKVHIFGSDREMRHIPELQEYMDIFKKSNLPLGATDLDCVSEGYDCDIVLTMGGNVDYLEGKDAVVFGLVPTEFRGEGREQFKKLLELQPAPGQTWIYFSTEQPLRVLRWTRDLDLMRLKYHVLMTYDLDSEIVVPFGYYRPFNAPGVNASSNKALETAHLQDPLLGKKGMIAWMASNCNAFWPRTEFISQMRDVLPLDDYGKCGRKECLPLRSEECDKLMASYKFYFAIPNAECKDYITEKFWLQSLSAGTVPVVVGSRKESYQAVAPPNSYIHFSDFESIGDLVDYLNRLNKDDEAYRRFQDWRSEGEVVLNFPTRPTIFCRALPHLHKKQDVKPYKYLSDSPWFKGCRMTPDRKVFNMTKQEQKILSKFENWSVWR